MDTYTIWDLEIIGNAEEGFKLNSWSRAGTIDFNERESDEDIIEKLWLEGFISTYYKSSMHVQDNKDGWLQIQDKTNGYKPMYNLELI